jgi:DNA-binding HxlR family transcriptional regulator
MSGVKVDNDIKMYFIDRIYDLPELKRCPIEATFKIIGKKWTILVLREMFRGITQFNRFLERIKGLTPKVLTNRLKELEKSRIISRKIVSESPVRIQYNLTDLGKQLESVMFSAASFSMRCLPKTVFKDGRPRIPEQILSQSP